MGNTLTDLARLVDMAGHDANLAASRVDDTRAVGSYQARLALRLQCVHDLHHAHVNGYHHSTTGNEGRAG